MMKNLQFHIVDAFIRPETQFTGNPAVVIVLPSDDFVDDKVKQNIAAQFNLSETVFLSSIIDEKDNNSQFWNIRWFTPKTEVELCGHATLAASFILATNEKINVIKYKSKFHEKLEAIFDPVDQTIMLDFPLNRCEKMDINTAWLPAIKQAIVGPENVDRIVDVQLSSGTKKLLIRLSDDNSDEFLVKIKPNFQQLLQIDTNHSVKGIIVTQKPLNFNGKKHFSSRYFAPWVGIQEDPVTGSAHTVSTPYWANVYQQENNQQIKEFLAEQLSDRTGILKCILGDNRIMIKGHAKIFCHGKIIL